MGTLLWPRPDGRTMRVEFRCYGGVRRALGAASVAVVLDDGATVGDALEALDARVDGGLPADLVVMREGRHLDRDVVLADDEAVNLTDSPMPEG